MNTFHAPHPSIEPYRVKKSCVPKYRNDFMICCLGFKSVRAMLNYIILGNTICRRGARKNGILRPLTVIETLNNLQMCNVEQTHGFAYVQ